MGVTRRTQFVIWFALNRLNKEDWALPARPADGGRACHN